MRKFQRKNQAGQIGRLDHLFYRLELLLACSAYRTNPIIRKVLESCSRSNSCILITYCRIILVSADCTNIFLHTRINLDFVKYNQSLSDFPAMIRLSSSKSIPALAAILSLACSNISLCLISQFSMKIAIQEIA